MSEAAASPGKMSYKNGDKEKKKAWSALHGSWMYKRTISVKKKLSIDFQQMNHNGNNGYRN